MRFSTSKSAASRPLPSHSYTQNLSQAAILVAALSLIALTWVGALQATSSERKTARARVEVSASNQALGFEEELNEQFLGLEQRLRVLEREWERNPGRLDLATWHQRALLLSDASLTFFIADAQGRIRSSTRPEQLDLDISERAYFRHEAALPEDDGRTFIGPAMRGLVTGRWKMHLMRRLDTPDGAFAGIVAVAYDTASLTRFYKEADLGEGGMIALVDTQGNMRALVRPGPAGIRFEPGGDIGRSPLFAALAGHPEGRWTGPSAPDGVTRIHAFRRLTDRNLIVVVGYDAAEAFRVADAWRRAAIVAASGATLFVLILAGILLHAARTATKRAEQLARDRSVLEAANAELEAAKAQADAETAQLEAIFAGMSDGVSLLDPELRLAHWNARFSEYSGLAPELLSVGLPLEAMLRAQAAAGEFGEVDPEAEIARRLELVRSTTRTMVEELPRPDGTTIELRRTPLRGGGYITLISDITVRKQAEQAERQAREQAEATAQEKSRFAAIVSHEIRTPLATLLSSLGLLADASILPAHRWLVSMAQRAGEALLVLVGDILEMAKMEAGRFELRPDSFDVRSLLEGVLDLFSVPASERQIALRVDVAADVPHRVFADPARLRQILINLVSNAVKFSSPGNVVLSARCRFEDDRGILELVVNDPGPRIADADREKLFQPFVRVEQAGGESAPGSGLGLAICQRLVVLMGGEIGFDPGPSPGNAFRVALPVALPPEGARQPSSGLLSGLLGGAPGPIRDAPRTRILLVDDVAANLVLTGSLLRRAGHFVEAAGSGREAIEGVQRQPFDLVLMDLMMPGLSGYETARRLRRLPGPARDLPIIALTASTGAQDEARCEAAGMQAVLGKPLDPLALAEALAQHVWSVRGTGAYAGAEEDAFGREPTLSDARVAELRDILPAARLGSLVETCFGDLGERLPLLRQALADADLRAVEAQAHAMQGVALGYGMAALNAQLQAIVKAARRLDCSAAAFAASGLESELERAAVALREALLSEAV